MSAPRQYQLLPVLSPAAARFAAEQRWHRPLRAAFPQNPATIGLFDLGGRQQLDLLDVTQRSDIR